MRFLLLVFCGNTLITRVERDSGGSWMSGWLACYVKKIQHVNKTVLIFILLMEAVYLCFLSQAGLNQVKAYLASAVLFPGEKQTLPCSL